jgi:hypothetical protein
VLRLVAAGEAEENTHARTHDSGSLEEPIEA